MTLKEKFRQSLTGHLSDEKTEVDINIAEKIADDYAIEFAEWLANDWTYDERWSRITDSKELLEMFKKEKGL